MPFKLGLMSRIEIDKQAQQHYGIQGKRFGSGKYDNLD